MGKKALAQCAPIFLVFGLLACGSSKSSGGTVSGAGGMGGAGGGSSGSGGASGAAAGSGGQPDVGMFQGLTGIQHLLGLNSDGPCAADASGVVKCPSLFQHPPSQALATFSLGSDISGDSGCGLTAQGAAVCWGTGIGSMPPAGPYTAIAVGDGKACGVRPNGTLTCFGSDTSIGNPPAGQFVDVSVERGRACALAKDGHVECWGSSVSTGSGRVDGSFKQVMVATSVRCTLDSAGSPDCTPAFGGSSPAAGPFSQIAPGSQHACGLRADGSVACWGADAVARLAPPPGTWTDIVSSYNASCVRSGDGMSNCWGTGYGDGGTELMCTPGSTVLAGMLQSGNFAVNASASQQFTLSTLPGFRWAYSTYDSTGSTFGLLTLEGSQALGLSPQQGLMNGQMATVDHWLLQRGATATDAGQFYCGNASTATLDIDEAGLALANVHALGGCPGTPVAGELTLCDNCGGLTGTADGVSFNQSISQGISGGSASGSTTVYLNDGSLLTMQRAAGGTLAWAILATAASSASAGAVYCAGAGSTWTSDTSTVTAILSGLSKLAMCPTTTNGDTISGCVR